MKIEHFEILSLFAAFSAVIGQGGNPISARYIMEWKMKQSRQNQSSQRDQWDSTLEWGSTPSRNDHSKLVLQH